MPENWQRAGFGIYIHWPFCAAKCPYCDFNSHVASSVDQEAWRDAFLAELRRYGAEFPDRTVSSVYFGGGTPSLMSPSLVDAVIGEISRLWPLAPDREITLEANPTSVEAGNFAGYARAGVDRVSVGVQALDDGALRALGRLHTAGEALDAVAVARGAFDRVSFDLIYARQDQSLDAWTAELRRALAMGPDHLSLYQLTIEDGTAFGERFRKGTLKGLPGEDLAADMFLATQALCEEAGLPAYEVSNHARPGAEGHHNLVYWRGGDYLGIGPGAHGRLARGGARFATGTALDPAAWLAAARAGSGEASRERLSEHAVGQERLLMGLRLREGVKLADIPAGVLDRDGLADMAANGLVATGGETLAVTPKGRPVLDGILGEIVAAEGASSLSGARTG